MIKHIRNISFNLLLKLKDDAFKSKKLKKIYLRAICSKFNINEIKWIPCSLFLGPQLNESYKYSLWLTDYQTVYITQRYNDILYKFEYSIDDAMALKFINEFDIQDINRG